MRQEDSSPVSIGRDEERRINEVLAEVKADGRSRALLLTGDGGVGKTSLVRRMALTSDDPRIDWLYPIDVDDPRYWLLSNLESRITDSLECPDPHFAAYRDELSRLPDYTRDNISQETIVSYLGRVKKIFASCYNEYADNEDKTIVIAFDTVETIRHTNLRSTLTQWMKAMPKSTLFILSGRPAPGSGQPGSADPIVADLENPYSPIPVTEVRLGMFEFSDSDDYLTGSPISDGLLNQEKDKLILLTRGQPLWLAFAIDYLIGNDIPQEAGQSIEYLTHHIPYDGDMTPEGGRLYQSFLRRLLAPYRQSDFWHEAIKRLAVVRQPIDRLVWEMLMSDLNLPEDTVDLDAAWDELIAIPWIRTRGNGRYITLHDAVAEAFAQRILPLHDPDQQWRHKIWRRALEIYTELAGQKEMELRRRLEELDEEISSGASGEVASIIGSSVEVDTLKRERGELRAARLYYLFLTNFEQGCDALLYYFNQADEEHDLFFQDLLALYLQRFLPSDDPSGIFDDVIKAKLSEFHSWLADERPDYYVAIAVMIADYFIKGGRPEAALELLDRLPREVAPEFEYRINVLRGNACMRIPARAVEGLRYFDGALEVASGMDYEEGHKLLAEAYKERGFYYRNIGNWILADRSYEKARDFLYEPPNESSSGSDIAEIASIQTNWAYVKGLAGDHDRAIELADLAVILRREHGNPVEQGISWSVCGEVNRYAKRYQQAWSAYAAAEDLLHERPNWNWLGLIYQEQAICLYQAWQDNILLTDDPVTEAKRLVTRSLDICLSHSIRGYPSALNRAGRIFGHHDPDRGLSYLAEGVEQARRLSDGWFLCANLIEYAELSYRAWVQTRDDRYLSQINEEAPSIAQAFGRDEAERWFPDLEGRWEILQGHLALVEYLYRNKNDALPGALAHYRQGFPALANRSLASSGVALIPGEFDNFERLFRELPPQTQADWQTKLMEAWRSSGKGSDLLISHLQELVARLEQER